MKKNLLFGACMLSLLASVSSCSNDEMADNNSATGKQISITAGISNGAESRVAYGDDGSKVTVAWSTSETFKMYRGTSTNGTLFSKDAAGNVFTGDVPTDGDGTTYYAVYPSDITNSGACFNVDLSSQVGTTADNGIKEFMVAETTDLTQPLTFAHKLVVLKLSLTLPDDVAGTTASEVVVSGLYNSCSYCPTIVPEYYKYGNKGDIVAKGDNSAGFAITDKNITAYVAVFPENVAENAVTITAKVGSDEYAYTMASAKELSKEVGKVIPVTVDLAKKAAYSWYDKSAATLSISTPDALAELSKIVSGDATALEAIGETSAQNFVGKTITLEKDIDLTSVSFSAIGPYSDPFKGTFDGGGHKITGLSINSTTTNQGLFGYIDGATVKNVAVEGTVKGTSYIGGVVGETKGNSKIINCSFTGTVATVVADKTQVGGVVGLLNTSAEMVACYSNATVTNDGNNTGGLVGKASGATITGCYSTGSVTGKNADYMNTGGLCGFASNSTIKACYTTASVSGYNGAAGAFLGCFDTSALGGNNYFIAPSGSITVGLGRVNVDGGTYNGPTVSTTVEALQSVAATMNSTWGSTEFKFESSTADQKMPLVIVKK